MKLVNAWELLKNNSRTNARAWLHETPLADFAVITKVIDAQTAEVTPLVQVSEVNTEHYTVLLLTPSSAALEVYAHPVAGDTVLLLFLQRYDPEMFGDPAEREAREGSAVIVNAAASGYTRFSGVGVLMRVVRASSALTLSASGGGARLRASVDFSAVFNMDVSFLFDDPNTDREHPVKALFGEQSPYDEEHWASVRRRHGMRELPDGTLAAAEAAVNEEYSVYAPITRDIQGAQRTSVGLGVDKYGEGGKPVETDAPITEVIHGKASVTRDIRSPQTITVGVGNDESGDAGEQRRAPVTIKLGEDADVNFDTGSGVVGKVAKSVDLTVKENVTAVINGNREDKVDGNLKEAVGGSLEEKVTGTAKYTSANTDIKSTAPVGINDGLYATGLSPYLTAETAALTALTAAASAASGQLGALDGLSGGGGTVAALGAAIAAFCAAMQAADASAHSSIALAVK
jgi:hypothetical protein